MERLTNKTFERWKSWSDKIEADLQNIINYHQVYEYFIQMVNENLLHIQENHGTKFCSFVRKCYGVHAAAGIRRHVKNKKDSISLMKLLDQLEKSANQFTYEFYLQQFPLEKDKWEWQKSTFASFSEKESGVGPSQVIDNTGITFILGGILTLKTPIFRSKLAF